MASTSKKRSDIFMQSEIVKKESPKPKKGKRAKSDPSDKTDSKTTLSSLLPRKTPESKPSMSIRNSSSIKTKAVSKRNSNKKIQSPSKLKPTDFPSTSLDEMDVQQLLALGEQSHVDSGCVGDSDFQDSSDSDNDFEEVKSADVSEPVIPKDGVNITLEVPDLYHKRKKKGFDMEAHLKRQINRVKKDLQLLMHKVHVLCWIAHLRFVNNTLNDPVLLSSCASLVKSKNLYPPKHADLSYLEGLLKWFHKNIKLSKDIENSLCTGGLLEELKYQINQKEAYTCKAFIFTFIILCRILGLKVRVVMSFQVLPVKPSLLELYEDVLKARSEKMKKSKEEKKEQENNVIVLAKEITESNCSSNSKRKSSNSSLDQKKKKKVKLKSKEEQDQEELSTDNEFESEHFKPAMKKNSKQKIAVKTKGKAKQATVKNSKSTGNPVSNDEDDDENFTSKSLRKNITKPKIDKKANIQTDGTAKKKEGSDVWTEIYLEAEEKWLCVDVPRQKIHCVSEIYSRATHPVAYIIACNNDCTLKDVTKRYVPSWHSDTRKKRVDDEWWNATMKNFLPPKTPQDKEEDEDINRQLMDQPLPSSISEFKDHPMYALKRHLLKFEAIYPPDAPTLGFIKGEPVYARECVCTLHSREMWYKQARLVRLKEEPYKIVKARPKYDKMTGEIKKDLPLELFGRWQTEDYIPPIAVNGKVPRNEYGNVDLFKPCMLPIGTVHLQIPALNRIAKKLDIDCAPATVGFDFHSGGSHPVFDGFVVCQEFKDVLLDAWNKEIDESSKKEEEKKEKRVYGNWKRLIRGLLIREKLKLKYAFGENSDEKSQSKSLPRASTSSSGNTN